MGKGIVFLFSIFVYSNLFSQINTPATVNPVNLTNIGQPYLQNFDSLLSSSSGTAMPAGWQFAESGSSADGIYNTGTGTNNSGNTYSFGNSSDRAIGSLRSTNLFPVYGAALRNNTGSIITHLGINYSGEQWRLGAAGRLDKLDFQYSLNATNVSDASATWIDVDQLDFIAQITSGALGALDGNENRTVITFTINGLNVPVNSNFFIRWVDYLTPGGNDALAIDDFLLIPYNNLAPPYLTSSVSLPYQNTATAGGNILLDNNLPISDRGVVWSTGQNPTLSSNNGTTSMGAGLGIFTGQISGLLPATTYYLRAYAINADGISYGNQLTFTTAPEARYFKSRATGNWNSINTWSQSADSITWSNATRTPTYADHSVIISANHSVTINSAEHIDQVVIEYGGILIKTSTNILTINNGPGDDIVVFGIYKHNSGSFPIINGTFRIKSGGILEVNNSSNKSSQYGYLTSMFYETNATFYWNLITAPTFDAVDITYFPNAVLNEIPIFKIKTNGVTVGSTASTTINGIVEIEQSTLTLNYGGQKIFRNGIRGAGGIIQSASSGPIIISGNYAEIAGAGVFSLTNNGIEILTTSSCNLLNNKTVNGGPLTIKGSLDVKSFSIDGTGNFILNNAATLITAHTDGVDGAVVLSGSRNFEPNSNIVLNATSPQNLGSTFTGSIGKLMINNPAGVILNNPITVINQLILQNGNIKTSSNALLTLSTTGTVIGGTTNSFVDGPMAIETNSMAEFIFPVGKSGLFNKIGIITESSSLSKFIVEYFDQAHPNQSVANSLINITNQGYWTIQKVSGNSSGKIKLYWSGQNNLQDIQNLVVSHFNGNVWENLGNNATASGTLSEGNITSLSTNNFTSFTFGFEASGITLPVKLVDFSGKIQFNEIHLTWTTASEKNNDYFSIERSVDGTDFTVIGKVNGAGNSSTKLYYHFIDSEVNEGQTYYYRLRQTDFNGQNELSHVINLNYKTPQELKITALSADQNILKVQLSTSVKSSYVLMLTDISGKKLLIKEINADKGTTNLQEYLPNLSSGIYFVTIYNNEQKQTMKFIKN